jgi:hypothetical protein
MSHLHKQFSDDEVKRWLERYINKEVERKTVCTALNLSKSRFFAILQEYRRDPQRFTVAYTRVSPTRIPADLERKILDELKADKRIIEDKRNPVSTYNYSFVKKRLLMEHGKSVSAGTIIARAKKNGYYKCRKRSTIPHDREVLTDYIGDLIQHDSSYHLWAPDSSAKWYLVTSLDDHSRFMLYAKLVEHETTWEHIEAVKSVVLRYGCPLRYYPDCHSIFRFVRGRDSFWQDQKMQTDDADPQWKQVLGDCNIKVIYALSPQAKGKVERSYRWLQDNLVRICARERISRIADAQKALDDLVEFYNFKQVHSATKEIPWQRFERCRRHNVSLFRKFEIKKPFQSTQDIFCLRTTRMVDGYRKVSISGIEMRIPDAPLHDYVELRISHNGDGTSRIRVWKADRLLDTRTILTESIKI